MNAHNPPIAIGPLDAIDAWFEGLGRQYLGRVVAGDPVLTATSASIGWRLRTLGRELAVTVDGAFPYSRPSVYLLDADAPLPHVEGMGKLCLRNPEVPSDPVMAIASAVGEARLLLRDIASGAEDDDFQEDFGLYWAQAANENHEALLLLEPGRGTIHASWTVTNKTFYVFSSKAEAGRWWRHRHEAEANFLNQTATIELSHLPRPDRYPKTGAELWKLVEERSPTGIDLLAGLVQQMPKVLPLVLTGAAPSGRRHAVGVLLCRPLDRKGMPTHRRVMEHGYGRGKVPAAVLCERYQLTRMRTQGLDSANTRLPYAEQDRLARARVAVVGCGALGSGVARLLAKSGVGHLALIDPEKLGWENIRRHQLGAAYVGAHKAEMLARAIAQENPDIDSSMAHNVSVQALLKVDPSALDDFDLIVSCTGSWAANAALDHHLMTRRGQQPAIYAWMEAHALASHAVLLMPGHSFAAGYDPAGHPHLSASYSRKPSPAECGGLTSPFGAVELAHAETLTARLALDLLRSRVPETVWRTWLTDEASLMDAEGAWTPEWIAARGAPDPLGGMVVGSWQD